MTAKTVLTNIWTWIGVVITGAIGSALCTAVFDWRLPPWLMKQKDAAPPVETVIDWWRTGGLIGVVSLVAIIIILCVLYRRPPELSVDDYTKDSFFGLTWRWRWLKDGSVNTACFCPHCDLQLQAVEVGRWPTVVGWNCITHGEQLRREGDVQHLLDDVTRSIQLNVRNGRWKQVVEHQRAVAVKPA